MVDIGTQSETDDLSDTETSVQGNIADRKPSSLQVVPEEEYEDGELVINCFNIVLNWPGHLVVANSINTSNIN